MTNDSKRSYSWTSFGQLAALDYAAAPALKDFQGTQLHAAAQVKTDFGFDAGGNRSHQLKQRIATDGSVKLEKTSYLGSYERELHETKATAAATPVAVRIVHRHSIGGFAVYTRSVAAATGVVTTKLTTILKDHLGSTDVLYTGTSMGSMGSVPNNRHLGEFEACFIDASVQHKTDFPKWMKVHFLPDGFPV